MDKCRKSDLDCNLPDMISINMSSNHKMRKENNIIQNLKRTANELALGSYIV